MGPVIVSKKRKLIDQKPVVVSEVKPATRWLNEAALVLLGYAVLVLLIFWVDLPPLRVGLAIVLMLFGSGYSLMALLFPRSSDLDGLMKAAIAGGLSLAVGGMIGFVLLNSIWGLRLGSTLVATILFNMACYIGIVYQSGKVIDIPKSENSAEPPNLIVWVPNANRYRNAITGRWVASKMARSNGRRDSDGTEQRSTRLVEMLKRKLAVQNTGSAAFTIVLMLVIALGVRAFVQAAVVPGRDPAMTEFFLLNENGLAEDYPTIVHPAQTLVAYYGIANREDQAADYWVEVVAAGETIGKSKPVDLDVGEELESAVIVKWPDRGDLALPRSQKVEFILYRKGERCRTLYLWLDVKPAGGGVHLG